MAKWKSMDWRRVVVRYLAAHVLLVGVVGVALLFHSLLVSMPGVVALAEGATVLFAALRFGTGPAIVAALAGVAAWSYLFLPPLFQFKPISLLGDDALLLAALFAASIAVAWLSARAKRLYADLQQENAQRAQLAAIVEFSEDAIIGKDLNGTILTWNRGAERLYGYSADEARGRPISMLAPAGHGDEMAHILARVARGERITRYETVRVRKDRQQLDVWLTVSPVLDRTGAVIGASAIARDITDRKRADERAQFLAQHDVLTGLPNRALFRDRIGQAIAQAQRARCRAALLFIDLDQFKNINDSLGHDIGDRLLQGVGTRLQQCLRLGDTVARFGGDEFIISLAGINANSDAMGVADKVLESLRQPLPIDGHELSVSASIGISFYPEDGDTADVLMRAADTAMYHAKERGRDNYQCYTPVLNQAAQQRQTMANLLRQGLHQDEFELYYQPQLDLQTGTIAGAEAQLRWQRPEAAAVTSAELIKAAEDVGLAVPLGTWALRQACAKLKRWRQHGHHNLNVAVTVSVPQLRRAGFVDLVAAILEETGVPARALELQISEGMLMAQSADHIAVLERLAFTGVRLTIDNFGTGYSSLAYLQRFPIHGLKIDGSFTGGIGRNINDSAIVTAVIGIAQSLDLKVVAQDVRTAAQAEFLRSHGCHVAQGPYYSDALSAEAFPVRVQMWTRARSAAPPLPLAGALPHGPRLRR